MPLTYPIALPSTPGTRRCKWSYEFGRGRAASEFTGKSQTYNWPKKLLRFGVEYPPMTRDQAEVWVASLYALDEGSCLFGDPQGQTARGLVSGYATNLLQWSEEYQRSGWTKTQCTVTLFNQSDPNSQAFAQEITADGGATDAAVHFQITPAGSVPGRTFTGSVWLKVASGTKSFKIHIADQGGVAITTSSITLNTTWTRYPVTGTMLGGDTAVRLIIGGGAVWTTGAVLVYGAQLEESAAASDYAPVGGPPVYSEIARDFLSFDGSDDYVTVPHNAAYNSNSLTVEAWFKAPAAAPAAGKYIASKWDAAGIDIEFAVQLGTTGQVVFTVSKTDNTADVSLVSASSFLDGQWHHVAAVKTAGGALSLYVDGKLEDSDTLGQEGDQTTHIVRFGNQVSGSDANAWSGALCECRIWNTARTQTQIRDNLGKQLVGNESGLVGYWRMDDKSGTVLDDLTSTANNGTVSGATWSGLAFSELLIANLAAGYAGVLDLGDWIQAGSGLTQRIYRIVGSYGAVAAAAANSGGVAHIEVRPNLRELPADQAALVVQNTQGVFELEEIVIGHEVDVAQIYGIAFNLREAY